MELGILKGSLYSLGNITKFFPSDASILRTFPKNGFWICIIDSYLLMVSCILKEFCSILFLLINIFPEKVFEKLSVLMLEQDTTINKLVTI